MTSLPVMGSFTSRGTHFTSGWHNRWERFSAHNTVPVYPVLLSESTGGYPVAIVCAYRYYLLEWLAVIEIGKGA